MLPRRFDPGGPRALPKNCASATLQTEPVPGTASRQCGFCRRALGKATLREATCCYCRPPRRHPRPAGQPND